MGRTLRKRNIPPQKPTKRQRTAAAAAAATPHPETRNKTASASSAQCYIKNMPNEIMGLIFGCLNLNDLANMLCISKWVTVHPHLLVISILIFV